MVITVQNKPCRVIDIYANEEETTELGFTLLEVGRTEPKMFYMTARPAEEFSASLKFLLKKL